MSTPTRHPPVALTASRWMRLELEDCARIAGTEIAFAETIPEARRLARHTRILVIGSDMIRRIRRPLSGRRRLVLVATFDRDPSDVFAHNDRVDALYVVVVPIGRGWLIDKLRNPTT